MWRHNYIIDRNEYLIFTFSESVNPWAYSLQFLFKSTNNSWTYKRKCEWVFFFLNTVYIVSRINKHKLQFKISHCNLRNTVVGVIRAVDITTEAFPAEPAHRWCQCKTIVQCMCNSHADNQGHHNHTPIWQHLLVQQQQQPTTLCMTKISPINQINKDLFLVFYVLLSWHLKTMYKTFLATAG